MRITKLLQRNIILYAAILLLMILATAMVSYIGVKRQLRAESTTANIALLRQTGESVDQVLRSIDSEILNYMHTPAVGRFMENGFLARADKQEILQELQSSMSVLKYVNSSIDSVYTYASQEGRLVSEGLYTPIQNFSDMGWLDALQTMQEMYAYIGPRELQQAGTQTVGSRNVISLLRAYPITNYKAQVRGAVVANVDEMVLYKIISKNQNEHTGTVFILDAAGQVISHGDKSKLGKSMREEEALREVFNGEGEGYISTRVDGCNCYVFHTTSSYTGWKYVSIVPMAEMGQSFQTLRTMLFVATGVMSLIAIAFLIYMLKKSYYPLDQFFSSVARTIENSPAANSWGDMEEIGALESAFGDIVTNNEKMQEQIQSYVPVVKWRLVMNLLMGSCDDYEDTAEKLALLGCRLYRGSYLVFVIAISERSALFVSGGKELSAVLAETVNEAERWVNEEGCGVAVQLYHSKVAILLSFEDTNGKQNMVVGLSIVEMVESFLKGYQGLQFYIGVGSIADTLSDITRSYMDAEEALDYKAMVGSNAVITAEDIRTPDEKGFYHAASLSNNLVNFLKNGDTDSVTQMLTEIFADAYKKGFTPEMMNQLSVYFILQGIRMLQERGVELEEELTEGGGFYEEVTGCETMSELKECVITIFLRFAALLEARNREKNADTRNNELIGQVVAYIQANYGRDDLSLGMLADKFHISVSYLSKLFKEKLEMNFIDYLIVTRLERAKVLLAGSDKKISQIAESVGYQNMPSFIRIFKKYTDQTPSEYRRTHGDAETRE